MTSFIHNAGPAAMFAFAIIALLTVLTVVGLWLDSKGRTMNDSPSASECNLSDDAEDTHDFDEDGECQRCGRLSQRWEE